MPGTRTARLEALRLTRVPGTRNTGSPRTRAADARGLNGCSAVAACALVVRAVNAETVEVGLPPAIKAAEPLVVVTAGEGAFRVAGGADGRADACVGPDPPVVEVRGVLAADQGHGRPGGGACVDAREGAPAQRLVTDPEVDLVRTDAVGGAGALGPFGWAAEASAGRYASIDVDEALASGEGGAIGGFAEDAAAGRHAEGFALFVAVHELPEGAVAAAPEVAALADVARLAARLTRGGGPDSYRRGDRSFTRKEEGGDGEGSDTSRHNRRPP